VIVHIAASEHDDPIASKQCDPASHGGFGDMADDEQEFDLTNVVRKFGNLCLMLKANLISGTLRKKKLLSGIPPPPHDSYSRFVTSET
jgi:hypothetical protein